MATVAIAALLLTPSLTLSKYVLDPVQYVFSLASGQFFGIRLISISPIIGTTVPGETLTAGTLMPLEATASYQWQRSTSPGGIYVDIPGATSKTYILTFDDNNSYIKVVARGTDSYSGLVTSACTGPVVTTATPISGIGTIAGAPYVDQKLTAGSVIPSDATVTYQWQKADSLSGPYTNIKGAVYSTYTLTATDVDSFIRVVAKGSGIYSGTVSAYTGPVRSDITPLTAISPISGTAQVGEILTAGALSPSGATASYQWQSSGTANGIYADIEGATFSTYTLQDSDNGRYIKVVATGTGVYSGSVVSAYTGPVTIISIPITAIGPISGTNQVGQTLAAGTLAPEGATATYQWLRADTLDGTYSSISGAVNNTYILMEADYSKYFKVTATGAGIYSGTVTSDPTSAVAARPLTDIGPTSGTTKVGEVLTAGTVSPVGATVSYQWQRATAANGTYSNIVGATSNTYTLTEGDANYYLKVLATGIGAYTGTVTSESSSMVAPLTGGGEITNLTAIADITGHTYVYQILTAGTVFPYGATVTYQWYRSDTAGGLYAIIPGATTKTYTTTAADKGCFFKVAAIGSGSFRGTITSVYAGPITSIPVTAIGKTNGTTKIGETLTAGTITPLDATVNYRWQKAEALDGPYTNILGAISNAYTLTKSDENSFIRVVATGTNLYSDMVISMGTGPVSATTIPVTAIGPIDGIPEVGHILTAGVTTPVGATVTYQWQRADTSGGPYSDIDGATGSSYTLAADDLSKYIKLVVMGSGNYETAPGGISSASLGPVTASPLVGISNIIGKAEVGQVLTAGTVTQYDAAVTYQWQRFNVSTSTYADIAGATAKTYTLTTADNNYYLRVAATAVPSSGYSGTVYSNNTGPVGSPNAIIEITDIVGITRVGQTLTAGTVLPYGSAVSYQWQSSSQADGTYANISGAVSGTYTLTAAEYGKYIRVVASGTGLYFGETISNPADIITKGIISAISPISGLTISGQTLTAGAVTPVGATVAYQWQRSDISGKNFTNINGAVSSNYTITAADEGFLLKVIVAGTGAFEGSAYAVTSQTISASGVTVTPIISIAATTGTPRVGGTLTAGSVNPGDATVTYQWQRATESGGPYSNISGATSVTYVLTPTDFGKYVRPVATGSGIYSGTVWPAGTYVNLEQIITALADITGTPAVGETVVAGTVTPAGATVIYQWQRSTHWKDPANATYDNIPGATSRSYTLTDSDFNTYVRVVVQGTGAFKTENPAGLISNYYGRITHSPNKLAAIGPITGVSQVGHKLTAGTVTPFGASLTYQWLRKNFRAETYHEIPGATLITYTTTADDFGSYIKVVATGAGPYSGWVESEPTDIISAGLVTGISAPAGTAVPGYTLTAGSTTPADATVTYQWQRSDESGSNFTNISGATSNIYLVHDSDISRYLRVSVTGYGAYTGSATSGAAGPISNTIPTAITAIGTITGNLQVNQTLTAGALTPSSATVTYRWQRADASGGPYENIIGAVGSSYTLTPADHGKYVKVLATGSGSYTGTVQSDFVGPVTSCPIIAISDFTGLASMGHSLVAGDVTPANATVTYRWYLGKKTTGPWDYMGETTKSIVIPARSITDNSPTTGEYIRVEVTGYGAFSGTISRVSADIQESIILTQITAIGPISGTSAQGRTLTAGALIPSGATVNYQWQRCPTYNGTYQNISGATASTYVVPSGDLGYYLRVVATGTGSYSGVVTSGAKGPVVTADQTILITGISDILYTTVSELSLTAGTLTPVGAEVTYQWQVSDSDNPDGSYSNIAGATSNIYTIPTNQVLNHYFRVVVTGAGIYTGTVTSHYTGPVVIEAIPVTGVSISGISKVGETLSAVSITPSSATVTYQWYTLTDLGEGSVVLAIPGAVYSTFTPSDNEYNYYIQVVVTGSGAYTGSVSATTMDKVIGVMTSATVNMTAPVTGEVPQTTAEVEIATSNLDYTVTGVTWNEALDGGAFKPDTFYTATVELAAKNSKVFQSAPFTPVVSSAASVETTTTIGAGSGNKVVFTVTFPQTELLELIDLLDKSEDIKLKTELSELIDLSDKSEDVNINEETETEIESDIEAEPLADDLQVTEEPAGEQGLESATEGDTVTDTSVVPGTETVETTNTIGTEFGNSEDTKLTIETGPLADDFQVTEEPVGEEGLEPATGEDTVTDTSVDERP